MSTDQFQIYMFHFRCPICAASPGRVLLRDYLRGWSETSPERLYSLLGIFGGSLGEVRTGESRWLTKKFAVAAGRVQDTLEKLQFEPALTLDSSLHRTGTGSLRFDAPCPVCKTPQGARQQEKYFTDWRHACKVQTGNLLYETGLILWAVLLGLPTWAPGSFLERLNDLRADIRRAGKDMSLFECPQCGRLTTCLYGHPNPQQTGFCRWCLDMGGGLGLGFTLDFDPDGRPVINMMKTDHSAPGRNSWDILPPEITQMMRA
jgi:hypothetical protein